MDFEPGEDHRLLGETLDRFLADNYTIDQRHGFAMLPERFSHEMWKRFAELGIIGAIFPENVGGFGGAGIDLMVVFEALGRHLVIEPFLPTLLAGHVLAESGKVDLLEKIIAGEILVALAHGEPDSRYDLAQVSMQATQMTGNWVLNGQKSVVLGGNSANKFVVSARTFGAAHAQQGISMFLVDRENISEIRDFGTLDGYGGAELRFENVSAQLLGTEGGGYGIVETAHARAIVAICAECLGAMEQAKELTVEYMHTRKQFGVLIGRFQVLQHRMADILIELEQMRSALINAAGSLDNERLSRERNISACKHLCGVIGRQIAEEAIQIHGGMGMTWEYPVGHYSKRIVMADHLFGDTDHHLERYIEFGKS